MFVNQNILARAYTDEIPKTLNENGDFRAVSGNKAKLRRVDLESVGSSNRFSYWARIFFMLTCHFQP